MIDADPADGALWPPTRLRYEALDGLRGVAAIAVATLHALLIAGRHGVFPNIGIAVDFFFGLSGFVVAHAYDGQLSQELTLAAFMQKRFHRLYPMIAFGVILGAVVWAWTHVHVAASALRQGIEELFLLPTGLWTSTVPYPLNPPMWSLFFEIVACLAYGLLAKLTPRQWLPWITGFAGVGLAMAILVHGNVTELGTSPGPGFFAGGLRVAYSFLLGVLAYRFQWHMRAPWLPPLLISAALSAILFCPGRHAAFQALAVIVLLPTIVLLGARTTTRMKRVWDVLGRLSYPLYIVHWPVLITTDRLIGQHVDVVPAVIAGVATSIAVAWLALRLYDEPLRRGLAPYMGRASTATMP